MGWARFDDLRSGTALACPTPDRVLVANRAQDVADVLDQVQRATDAGRWAFAPSNPGPRPAVLRAVDLGI